MHFGKGGATARPGLILVAVALSCGGGLSPRDVSYVHDFTVLGSPVMFFMDLHLENFPDYSKLTSLTLRAAKLDATDGGDLSFVSGASVAWTRPNLSTWQIASLSEPTTASSANLNVIEGASAQGPLQVLVANSATTRRSLRLTLTFHGVY